MKKNFISTSVKSKLDIIFHFFSKNSTYMININVIVFQTKILHKNSKPRQTKIWRNRYIFLDELGNIQTMKNRQTI